MFTAVVENFWCPDVKEKQHRRVTVKPRALHTAEGLAVLCSGFSCISISLSPKSRGCLSESVHLQADYLMFKPAIKQPYLYNNSSFI